MSKSAGMMLRVLLCQILILQSSLAYAANVPSGSASSSTSTQKFTGPVAVTSIAVTPSQAKAGDTITETATITATSDFKGVLHLGIRPAAQGAQPVAAERSILAIKAGESVTRSLNWKIPENITSGNYRVFARITDKKAAAAPLSGQADKTDSTTAVSNERVVVSRETGLISITAGKGTPTTYTIQLGATKQSLRSAVTLPSPTIVASGWASTTAAPAGTSAEVMSPGTAYYPTLQGNAGNDVFYNNGATYTAIKAQPGGINTVVDYHGWGVYTASDNVANVIYKGGSSYKSGWVTLEGNALDNTLVGGDNGITLIAGAGNDTLVGGKGNDIFVIPESAGNVTVIGLHPGEGSAKGSVVRLDFGTFGNFAELKAAMVQQGSDVVLTRPNGKKVTFVDFTIDGLVVDLFEPTSVKFTEPLPGVCGAANQVITKVAPTGDLCSAGEASPLSKNEAGGFWTWSCTGKFGGNTASCATLTYLPADGVCGAANNVAAAATPSNALCATGLASSVDQGANWTWTCQGLNGGKDISCSAPIKPADGACGTAGAQHSGIYASTAPTKDYCISGANTAVRGSGPWYWDCKGLNSGKSVTCMAGVLPTDGQCGAANGSNVSSAPTSGFCSKGAASAVAGSGPFTWSCAGSNGGSTAQCATVAKVCIGTSIPAPADVILPPQLAKASNANDIVGVSIQNTGEGANGDQVITFAQVFKQGQVKPTDALIARISGAASLLQMDMLSQWPDGSVKLASLSLQANICGKSQIPAMIAKAGPSDPAFNRTPVDLASKDIPLTVKANFTGGNYSAPINLDLGAALKTALASKPDFWLKGPLATQARVEVPITGGSPNTLRITADVTAYADGTYAADVQFNNDLTKVLTGPAPNGPLPKLQYSANIALGNTSANYTLDQVQYTGWHKVLRTRYQPFINVQHDLAYLQHAGAVLPYDRTTGVNGNVLASLVGVNAPLANSGVQTYMPMTGGRPDIGYTTYYNTLWLVTQDARIAQYALLQSDTSGAIPWNFKLDNGHWLTPGDYPMVWPDYRAGYNISALVNMNDTSYWVPEGSHQPNLNYVPYIMTGSRWSYDRLNAQAAYDTILLSPSAEWGRCVISSCDNIISSNQLRGAAWQLREVQQAAFVGRPGTFEQPYYTKVVENNYAWVKSMMPKWESMGGEVYGYLSLPSVYGDGTALPEWQEDFMTGIMVQGAQMGFTGAKDVIAWQKKVWLPGRFLGKGMNPYDGAVYLLSINNRANPFKTWAEIEANTQKLGWGNPTNSWGGTRGYFCPLARSALGSALTLFPGDPALTQALTWLNGSNPPDADKSAFQNDPTFNLVPLQPE